MDTKTNNQNSELENNHSLIIEKQNINALILSIVSIVGGLFLTFHSYIFKMSKNLEIALVVIGILCILIGVSILILKSKQRIYAKTGSVIKQQICYFSRDELNIAQNLLINGKFENEKAITLLDTGNLYFEVQISKDKCFAAVQIFEFVPFAFQPTTQIYYFTDNQALKFYEYMQRCKSKV